MDAPTPPAERSPEEDCLDILPDNHAVWDLWRALGQSWRMAFPAMGPALTLGLPVQTILAGMDLLGVKKRDRRTLLAQVQEMESVALPILNAPD